MVAISDLRLAISNAICGISTVVVCRSPKPKTGVRFPHPVPSFAKATKWLCREKFAGKNPRINKRARLILALLQKI